MKEGIDRSQVFLQHESVDVRGHDDHSRRCSAFAVEQIFARPHAFDELIDGQVHPGFRIRCEVASKHGCPTRDVGRQKAKVELVATTQIASITAVTPDTAGSAIDEVAPARNQVDLGLRATLQVECDEFFSDSEAHRSLPANMLCESENQSR